MTAEIEPIIGIPETWISVKIGDLAIVKGGKRLPKGVTYSKEKTPFPYIRVTDFKGGSIDTNNLRYITKEIRDIISRYTISSSDIYISIAGTIGVVGMVPDELDNANLTENAAKIVLCKYIDSQYIYRLLDSPLIQQQIETQTISTTQPKLALFRIESLKIPLPPLNEQQRIVSTIEQLTDRSHKARAALADVPKLIAQFRLDYGDILFTEGGDRDKLGRGTIWRNEIEGCIHQNHVYRARLYSSEILPEYISLATKTEYSKDYFFNNASQTVNLASINMTTLGKLPIAIPPIAEQKAICNKVAQAFKILDSLRFSYQVTIEEINQLDRSILAKAFRGELVPQDPNDEPAAVLLERIRAEREQTSSNKQRGKTTRKNSSKQLSIDLE